MKTSQSFQDKSTVRLYRVEKTVMRLLDRLEHADELTPELVHGVAGSIERDARELIVGALLERERLDAAAKRKP